MDLSRIKRRQNQKKTEKSRSASKASGSSESSNSKEGSMAPDNRRSELCRCVEIGRAKEDEPCVCPPFEYLMEIAAKRLREERQKTNKKNQAKRDKYAEERERGKKENAWPLPEINSLLRSEFGNKLSQVQALNEKLEVLGFPYKKGLGNCARAGILNGKIKFQTEADLDAVIFKGKGMECGHTVAATLREVLRQCDYGGDEMLGYGNSTVSCDKEKFSGCHSKMGKFFLTGICTGEPRLDWGRGHHHCTECHGFGECVHSWTTSHCKDCGSHYHVRRCSDSWCEECRVAEVSTFEVYMMAEVMAEDFVGCKDEPLFEYDSDDQSNDEVFRVFFDNNIAI